MRPLFPLLIVTLFSACLQIGMPGDSGGASASAGSTGSAVDAGLPSATGANCTVDPSTGVSLCAAISSCPDVPVDTDQYPGCGYRIAGNALDLECLCNGDSLCPIGAAASCTDAKALLADQSALGVCAEVADGRCTSLTTTVTPTSTASSSCDKDCRAACDGDPGCITFCGC